MRSRHTALRGFVWVGCLAAMAAGALPLWAQGEDTGRSSRPARSSDGGDAALERKVDQVLEQQGRILARLDEIMEELKIVKIRATVR
jgi:hypothetical protein